MLEKKQSTLHNYNYNEFRGGVEGDRAIHRMNNRSLSSAMRRDSAFRAMRRNPAN